MKDRPATRRTSAFAGVLFCLAVLLAGCATTQVASLQQRWPDALPASAAIAGVPFYPQEDYHCGPAALAMVAGVAGASLLPDQFADQVYLPGRQGSLQVEMFAAGRRHGLLPYRLAPRIDAVLQEVAAGNPVVVLQNLSFSFAPVWHYAVVIGFDRERNTLLLHSGRTEKLEMSLYAFERTWARGDNWAMLLLSPARLPATADADAYAASAAALERSALRAAQTAYATGLQAWPTHRTLLLGAGNAAYGLGQLDAAVEAYRALTRTHPDFPDGWNNLAQALSDRGRMIEAAAAIGKAVSLGGPRLPRYLELQKAIAARR